MRGGDFASLAIWLMLPLFFIKRDAWMRPVLSIALLTGSLNWIMTGLSIINVRIASGGPWTRLAAIMVLVSGITALSAVMLMGRKAKVHFSLKGEFAPQQSLVFMITFIALELMRTNLPIQIILADRFLPGTGRIEIFLVSFYAAWMSGKMLDPDLSRKYRPVLWTLFSALFFLQLILGLSGFEKFLMTGSLHLPLPALIISGPLYRFSSFFMPILFLSTVFLAGPAWCSHLCYIGSWDDLSSRAWKEKKKPLPAWTKKARLGIFIAAIALPLMLRFNDISSGTALGMASAFGMGGILVMVMVSGKRGVMAHCTSYCPIGLAAITLGKISPWRLKIGEGCNQCMLCTHVCRYNALSREDLLKGKPGMNCTLCGDCLSSCKNSHIAYAFAGNSSGAVRKAFISALIVIHSIFLAVARI